jgi:hypothetical protein
MSGDLLDTSLAALLGIVRASLRALRVAVADLSFAPENVRRVADEAETLSAALGRLDRMLALSPAAVPTERSPEAEPISLSDLRSFRVRLQRLTEPNGRCSNCGGVRL